MHRRHRHLNARDAGATMVLDARFLSGNDGDAIGTWSSRTSSAYDMTQATAANKPLLKLGVNGVNGQAAVRFDGTNDFMTGANEAISTCSVFSVAYNTNASTFRCIFARCASANYNRDFLFCTNTTSNSMLSSRSNGVSFPFAQSNDFTTGNHVVYGDYDGTNLGIRVDLKTKTTVAGISSTATLPWELGAFVDGTQGRKGYWSNNIGTVVVFKNSVTTSSVEKRLSHAMAFSFKIACS